VRIATAGRRNEAKRLTHPTGGRPFYWEENSVPSPDPLPELIWERKSKAVTENLIPRERNRAALWNPCSPQITGDIGRAGRDACPYE